MKLYCGYSCVIGLVLSTGAVAADKAKKTYKLPKSPKAVVISMDYKGGFTPRRKSDAPALSILRDGTVQIPDRFGFAKDVTGKISEKELQALLRFALKEHKFFEYDAAKVKAKMKKAAAGRRIPQVADAATLVIEIKTAEKSNKASQYALGLMASQYKGVAEIQQLAAIQTRLNRLMNVLRVGGPKEVAKALKLANAELKKKYPKADPLKATELQSASVHKDGKKTVSFSRYGRKANGRSDGTYVNATLQYPAKGKPMVFVRAKLN